MFPDIPTSFDGLQSLPIAPSEVEQVATLGMAYVVLRALRTFALRNLMCNVHVPLAGRHTLRTLVVILVLGVSACHAQAQDPGMDAAQQAMQQSQMAAQQAMQASQQAMQDAQQANQQAMQQMMQATQNNTAPACCIPAAKPKFSIKPGVYNFPTTVKITDATRGAIIYYSTDGWTPTEKSTRYMGPIEIDSTTTLQAIAVAPYHARSYVASAQYTVQAPATQPSAATPLTSDVLWPGANAAAAGLLLAKDTPVPLLFAAAVSSRTAEVGDKIPMTLAEDLKIGDTLIAPKGSPAVVIVIQVDKTGAGGAPGGITFKADSLTAGGTVIKLHRSATREGDASPPNAAVLIPVVGPFTVFKHGKDADIKPGTPFTAFVSADTPIAPRH
jgi:type II secretory pathway pseudopilin PulG